jgi:hypothetical protein
MHPRTPITGRHDKYQLVAEELRQKELPGYQPGSSIPFVDKNYLASKWL